MSQSERIFFILKILDQKGGISTRDVVQAFEVSERQAKRDIEYMRDRLGAPIVWKRESGHYEYSGPWRALLPGTGSPVGTYQQALHSCTVALAIRSVKDGSFLMVNPAFERLSGRGEKDLVGHSLSEPALENSEIGRIMGRALREGKDPCCVTHSGRNFLVTSSVFECSGDECVLTLVQDVSDVRFIGRTEGEKPAATEFPEQGDAGREGQKRILVVDDDAMVLDMMGAVIESFEYNPILASNGAEALEILSEDPDRFDLVVLDIIMPGMDGFDLFNRIQLLRPGFPCIFISGFSPRPLDPYFSLPGVRGCLQKPIARHALGEALRKALEA